MLIAPDTVRDEIESLRKRAAECIDLSADCLTDDGRDALLSWAEQSQVAAANLEFALERAQAILIKGLQQHNLTP